MTQTYAHPDQPAMRHRAQSLIAAFDALPAPQTLTDMLRTARLLMVLDRMLTQMWKAPTAPSTRKRAPAAAAGTTPEAETKAATETPAEATPDAPSAPLNRQQRRAQERAKERANRDKSPDARGVAFPGGPVPRRATS